MVPDDSDDDTNVTPSSAGNARAAPAAGDASASPSAADRYDPKSDSDGFLAPGDDAPADAADIFLYGLLGGIAGSVLSFVPFATVLGGAVAGYLCGGTPADALKTGTVAGLVMTLPFVAMVAFLLLLFGFAGAPAEFGILALLAVGVGAVYTLGSGVIGGYLGHSLRGKL